MLARSKTARSLLAAAGVTAALITTPAPLTAEPAATVVAVPYLEEREYSEAELMALPPFDRCHVLAQGKQFVMMRKKIDPEYPVVTMRMVLEVVLFPTAPETFIQDQFRIIQDRCQWREGEVTLDTPVPLGRMILLR
mgnify:CR=1 FL=1